MISINIFFIWPKLGARAEIRKKIFGLLVDLKMPKFPFEINWLFKAPKTPSIPKLKFKDLSESPTPAPPGPLAAVASTSVATAAEPSVAKSSPKIVFKNLAVDKKKDPPKQADLFSDAVHLDRYVNNKYV